MHDDNVFRWVLILGLAAVLPAAFYFRLKSQAGGEPLDRRQEGLFILLTLRPAGLASMAGVVAYVIDPRWMSWSQVELAPWLRWSGAALGAAGGLLLVWTMRTLGPNLTDTVVTRKRHTLVTAGPYRWVRHPFYVAAALAITANSLVTANWFLAATGGLALALILLRTRIEEEKLVERFGDEYRDYMERTGRFFPRSR